MSMYHAFTLPLEDFNRVFNYRQMGNDIRQNVSLRSELENVYGKNAGRYISQLITDLNGGVRTQAGTEFVNKLIGKFKKNAVFASASVTIQQPSAIGRAVALINPKYFFKRDADGKFRKSTWNELKQYAPIAVIKEMGYFDTNVGQTTIDWVKAEQYDGFAEKAKGLWKDSQYRDDVLSKLPALADEKTWCWIWSAVKAETRDKTGLSGEALLKKLGNVLQKLLN